MSIKIVWHKVAASLAELPFTSNNMCVVEVGAKKISLGKFHNQLFAFAYKCPHASGIMSQGYIDALGNVVCPLHRYKFNITNGKNVSGEGYRLATYFTEIKEDGIYIGWEEKPLFSW